jgi:hypothetical protein
MAPELKKLSAEELEFLYKAPLLVSILIAGADGQIDRNEINGAIETARKKAKGKSSLQRYYQEVSEDFEDKLKILLQGYPSRAEQRSEQIASELTILSGILIKVEGSLGSDIYQSLKSMATNIAKSSGGIFGLKSIGPEEARYIDLKMIQPPPSATH